MLDNFPIEISAHDLDRKLKKDSDRILIIDVRETSEILIAKLNISFIHLPLSQFQNWQINLKEILDPDKQTVIICHAGIRSKSFGQWLLENKYLSKVWNLKGGINEWSNDVDRSIPKY